MASFLGLANAGGMGGGTIMIPVLLIFFNYSLKEAITISYLLMFGGAIGSFLRLAAIEHPKSKGPIVNYDLLLLSVPMLSMGAIFGEFIDQMLPDIFIIFTLLLISLQTLSRTFERIKKHLLEEKREREKIEAKEKLLIQTFAVFY